MRLEGSGGVTGAGAMAGNGGASAGGAATASGGSAGSGGATGAPEGGISGGSSGGRGTGGECFGIIVQPEEIVVHLDASSAVLPCVWKVPPAPTGQSFGPNQVRLQFTPQGGTAQDLGYVSEADCSRANHAWYYDAPASPTEVLLCPTTCDAVKSSVGRIDIVLGCPTVPAALN